MLDVARTNDEFAELSYSAASTWNTLQRTFKLDTMGHLLLPTITADYAACFQWCSVLLLFSFTVFFCPLDNIKNEDL